MDFHRFTTVTDVFRRKNLPIDPYTKLSIFLFLAIAVVLSLVSLSASAAGAEKIPKSDWPDSTRGCIVSEGGGGFAAGFVDSKTKIMVEQVRIQAQGEPVVVRTTKDRGIIRKNCEVMVLDVLGHARARQILRLSD